MSDAVEAGRFDRRKFAKALRDARNASNLNQTQLGTRSRVSRDVIARLERAQQDPAPKLAQRLAEILDAPELISMATNAPRPSRGYLPPAQRDEVLMSVLSSRVIDRLVIVAVDWLNIVKFLKQFGRNLPPTVQIVFPTRDRQDKLRATADRPEDLKPQWNVERQIKRIFEETHADRIGADVQVYESDGVTTSFVLVGSSDGTMVVNWPTLPNLDLKNADQVPALVTMDAAWIQSTEEHLRQILTNRHPLTHLKAVVLESGNADERAAGHRLSMFFELGRDSESKLIAGGLDAGPREGFAVALVLVHGVITQPKRPLDRRLLLPFDEDTDTHELFSTHISVEDFNEITDRERSTLDPKAAITELEKKRLASGRQEPPGIVRDEVFRRAAVRGFQDEFGVLIDPAQLVPVELHPDLWLIPKPDDQLPVIPRLFTLDLSLAPRAQGEAEDRRGDRGIGSVVSLELAFQADPRVRAMGVPDLLAHGEKLNHFLTRARELDGGQWLRAELEKLGIAEL